MSQRTVWIRADGSREMGMGHIMRTMAIAEVAAEHSWCVKYLHVVDAIVGQMITSRGFETHPLRDPDDIHWTAMVRPDDIIIFDGYHIPFHVVIATAGMSKAPVVLVDDERTIPSEVMESVECVVRPGLSEGESTCHNLLAGPRWALVRREFLHRRRRRGDTRPTTVALTFGATDPAGVGPLVVGILATGHPFERVLWVQGPGAERPTRDSGCHGLEVLNRSRDFAAILDRADVVVTAAGSTVWEAMTMGLPMAVVAVNGQQERWAREIAAKGVGLAVPTPITPAGVGCVMRLLSDPDVIRSLSQRCLAMTDGLGAARLFRWLNRS